MSSLEAYETVGHYINGRVKDGSVETLDVTNPATGKVTKKLACAAAPQLEEAINAASFAFAVETPEAEDEQADGGRSGATTDFARRLGQRWGPCGELSCDFGLRAVS